MTESKTPIMDAFYEEIAGDSDAQLAMKTFDKAKQLELRLAAAKAQIATLDAILTDTETQSQRNFDSWMKEVAKRNAGIQKCERIARLACVTGLHTVANSIADDIRAAFPEVFK